MVFSNNFQKVVICVFSLFMAIAFNACGESVQDQVLLGAEPDTPEVQLIDLPEDDDSFDGATAPFFQLDYVIENRSEFTFILTNLILTVNPVGADSQVQEVVVESSQLDEDQEETFYSLALAIVDPNVRWQSSVNAGASVDPDTTDTDDSTVRTGLIWYIDNLPVVDNNAGTQSTLYEVNMRAVGFFIDISDSTATTLNPNDETISFDRTFRFFTR